MAFRLLVIFLLFPMVSFAAEPYEVAITKHMALAQRYPDEAKLYGVEGDAIVRVRIAPNGKILQSWVLEEPQHPSLKKAVKDMLKRANPAPKVPKSYLNGDPFVELIFPVAFRVHAKPGYLDDIDRRFQDTVKSAYNQPREEIIKSAPTPKKPAKLQPQQDLAMEYSEEPQILQNVPDISVKEAKKSENRIMDHVLDVFKAPESNNSNSIIKGTFD
jgi:TonB family protein